MKSKFIIYGFLAIVAIFSACSKSPEQSSFEKIAPYGWIYGDTLSFVLQPADTILHGDLAVVIRHTNGYEYSSLWLEMRYADADTLRIDTIQVPLADPYGRWLGKGIGVSYQLVDTVGRRVLVATSTPIRISHIMRADTLPEIEQVGVIFLPETFK